ncbi:diphosphomevalonate decarboxylase [Alphaproteobacteria bacterium]|nr:diphosphomevalonate decarboxylase [Alphaproteobacteria bacterium]
MNEMPVKQSSWTAKAPSNIALIKYMGKKENNVPLNASLSYTLDGFITEVSLELTFECDKYVGDMQLSNQSIDRFINHLKYIKEITNCQEFFAISSTNTNANVTLDPFSASPSSEMYASAIFNAEAAAVIENARGATTVMLGKRIQRHVGFPEGAGMASSASSFAALTVCAFKAICDIKGTPMPSVDYMSSVSRVGSGSSCRSFFAPWCLWRDENAEKIDIKISKLLHDVIIVDDKPKEISSSLAHKLVQTSLLMPGREKRVEVRLEQLILHLNNLRWDAAYQVCWEEFWDMHVLFETASPSFGYMHANTIRVLSEIRKFWKRNGDGPIVTIDAGPNVHLLWRAESLQHRHSLLQCLQQMH